MTPSKLIKVKIDKNNRENVGSFKRIRISPLVNKPAVINPSKVGISVLVQRYKPRELEKYFIKAFITNYHLLTTQPNGLETMAEGQ